MHRKFSVALQHIKKEPIDEPIDETLEDLIKESMQNNEEPENLFIPTCLVKVKRRQSTIDEPELKRQCSEISEHELLNAPTNASIYQNCQTSESGINRVTVTTRRDPRMRNITNINNSSSSYDGQRRSLVGSMTAEEVIRTIPERRSDHRSQALKDAVTRCADSQKLLNSQSFYANLPNVALAPGGSDQQRSPMLTNNHNALFKTQATTDNILDCLIAQRYSNIPQSLQSFGQRVGADLDTISQSMRPAVAEESSQISYNENTRTLGSQTEPIEHEEPAEQPKPCSCKNKKLKSTEAQTTKNHGGFYCAIDDLSTLTTEQRKGLMEFKQVRCLLHFKFPVITF